MSDHGRDQTAAANTVTIYEQKYSGFSRSELRRRAFMFKHFAEQAGRDLIERNNCERIAIELETASEQAPS